MKNFFKAVCHEEASRTFRSHLKSSKFWDKQTPKMLKICVKDFFKEFVTCHLLKAWWKLLSFTEANLVIARALLAFGRRLDNQ